MADNFVDALVKPVAWCRRVMAVIPEMRFARNVAHRRVFRDYRHIVEDATKQKFFGTARSERAQLFSAKILRHWRKPAGSRPGKG